MKSAVSDKEPHVKLLDVLPSGNCPMSGDRDCSLLAFDTARSDADCRWEKMFVSREGDAPAHPNDRSSGVDKASPPLPPPPPPPPPPIPAQAQVDDVDKTILCHGLYAAGASTNQCLHDRDSHEDRGMFYVASSQSISVKDVEAHCRSNKQATGYIDKNGDSVSFAIEDGKLIKYVNGNRNVGNSDRSGVVTSLKFKDGNPADVRDQHGWGSNVFPWEVVLKLKEMADAVGVQNNLPDSDTKAASSHEFSQSSAQASCFEKFRKEVQYALECHVAEYEENLARLLQNVGAFCDQHFAASIGGRSLAWSLQGLRRQRQASKEMLPTLTSPEQVSFHQKVPAQLDVAILQSPTGSPVQKEEKLLQLDPSSQLQVPPSHVQSADHALPHSVFVTSPAVSVRDTGGSDFHEYSTLDSTTIHTKGSSRVSPMASLDRAESRVGSKSSPRCQDVRPARPGDLVLADGRSIPVQWTVQSSVSRVSPRFARYAGHYADYVNNLLDDEEEKRNNDEAGCFTNVVRSTAFKVCGIVVILLNFGLMIYEVDWRLANLLQDSPADMFLKADVCFTSFYLMELFANIHAYRITYFCGEDLLWNWFDISIVSVSVLDITFTLQHPKLARKLFFLKILRFMRVSRLIRMFRAMRFFKEMRLMIDMFANSLYFFFWCLLLLLLFLSFFAIFFVQSMATFLEGGGVDNKLRDDVLVYFGSVSTTMLSLFMSVSGGNDWATYHDIVRQTGPVNDFVYILFILFSLIAFFNVIGGVFCEKAMALAKPSVRDQISTKHKKDAKDAADLCKLLREFVKTSSTINQEQFEQFMEHPEALLYFEMRGVSEASARRFFKLLLDMEESDSIQFGHFISSIVKLDGYASCLDLHVLYVELKQFRKTLEERLLLE